MNSKNHHALDPKQTATTLQMAAYMESKGDHRTALDLYRKALPMLFQKVGHNHPTVAETYEKVASILEAVGNREVLFKQGKLDEAYQMFHKSKGTQPQSMMEEPMSRRRRSSARSSLSQRPLLLPRSFSLLHQLSSSRSLSSVTSTRSSLRKETRDFLDTLRNYLNCREKMNAKYHQVDKTSRLATLELKTDSGGIQVEATDDPLEFKDCYRQQSLEGGAVHTIDELYRAAETAKPIYQKTIEEMVSKVCEECDTKVSNVNLSFANLKGQDRALEKAQDDYDERHPGPGVSWLYDIVRGSVEFGSAAEIQAFVRAMYQNKSIHIVKAKNRFQEPSLTGYRDICIHFRLDIPPQDDEEDGFQHICEVQIHHKALNALDYQLGSHAYYEFFRSFFAGATGCLKERLDDLQLISEGAFVDESFLDDFLFECEDVERLERLAKLFANQLCEYENAIQVYERIAELEAARHGPKHPLVIGIYCTIADILQEKGCRDEALAMYEESIEVAASSLGCMHPAIAAMCNNMAGILEKQDRLDDAYEMAEKGSKIFKHRFGENHPSVAKTYNTMAGILTQQNKFDEALELHQKSLNIKLNTIGEINESVGNSYMSIGEVLESQDKLDEAMENFEKALNVYKRTVGQAHSSVAYVLQDMAELFHEQDKLGKALDLYRMVLQIKKQNLGEESSAVANTYNCMAELLADQNQYDAAVDMCQKALRIKMATVGGEHSSVASVYTTLGGILLAQGKFEEAMDMQWKALRVVKHAMGNEHFSLVEIYRGMGEILLGQEQLDEAVARFKQSLALATKVYGEEHTEVSSCYNDLGDALMQKGKTEDAMKMYEESLRLHVAVHGDDHVTTAIIHSNIATVFAEQGDFEAAIVHFNHSLDWHKSRTGEHAHSLITTFIQMGRMYLHRKEYNIALEQFQYALAACVDAKCTDQYIAGNVHVGIGWAQKMQPSLLEESLVSYRRAVKIYIDTVGAEHLCLANVYNNIGEVLALKGKLDEAKDYLMMARAIFEANLDKKVVQIAEVDLNLGIVRRLEGALKQSLRLLHSADEVFAEKAKTWSQMDLLAKTRANISEVETELQKANHVKRAKKHHPKKEHSDKAWRKVNACPIEKTRANTSVESEKVKHIKSTKKLHRKKEHSDKAGRKV